MTFISRAQNFEDFRLFRAFKGITAGKYIDIGAWDPAYHSVSYNFYEAGWRGVNVEPLTESFKKLEELRPFDININAFVTHRTEKIKFFSVPNSGLSTQNKENLDDMPKSEFLGITEMSAEPISLTDVFNRLRGEQIQWLKIDVEGAEEEVLASWGNNPARPLVVVVEATIPSSSQLSEMKWESELFTRGYVKSYFDGLNNFYCLEGNELIQASISSPISIFDDVLKYEDHMRIQILDKVLQSDVGPHNHTLEGFLGQQQVEVYAQKIMKLYESNEHFKSKQEELFEQIKTQEATIRDLNNSLNLISKSKFFRYSTPLRRAWYLILKSNPRELSRVILVRIAAKIIKKPLVKKIFLKLVPIRHLYRIKRFLKKEDQIPRQQNITHSEAIVDPKIDSLLGLFQGIKK